MVPVFLAVVGTFYVLLAAWCLALPRQTSRAIGYELRPGDGLSEYRVMYGGVQGSLGLYFLWPLFHPESAMPALEVCLLTHAGVVLLRSIGFFLESGIGKTIRIFAVSEWVVFLGSLFIWWRTM